MPSSHSEITAGAFVAFCLALLFVMVFAVGDCGRFLRGSQEREVLFSSVTGLQPNSAVNYAGVEIGRVREMRIVEVDEGLLKKMPVITVDTLGRLPLSFEEAEELKALKNSAKLDAGARALVGTGGGQHGRKMILLVLEIHRSEQEFRLREDDLVRLATTVMGDSTVEISPGSGDPLQAGKALLGDSSSLFTQLSDSVREIRNLLTRVSDIVGDEEKVNIRTTLANIKKASEDLSLASATVRQVVGGAAKPVKETIKDLQAGMSEARTAVTTVRKTIQEVGPKVVTVLDSGKEMLDSGRKAADSAEKLLAEARTQLNALLRNASGALKTAQELLSEAGDALDENRPTARRAIVDLRESLHNIREASARVRRAPWLLFQRPRVRNHEIVLLEASARSLSSATAELTLAMENLRQLAADPDTSIRRQDDKVRDLIKKIRDLHNDLADRKKAVENRVNWIQRKKGGKYLEKAREEAD